MKTQLRTAGASVVGAVRPNSRIVTGLALLGLTGLASAQNAGVAEIVDAIEALAPDMGLVIAAAIGIAVIGIGAAAALALGKRLMK